MISTIRSIPADSAEYARDYNNGWRVSQRCAEGALDRADERNVSHAWYDGYEDYALGNAKWTKKDERLAGDHEPEVQSYRCPCCGTDVMDTPPVCGDCRKAGCEATTDAVGELDYWECQQERSGYVCSGWACTDCLIMLANGDEPSDMNSQEQIDLWRKHFDATRSEYHVTLGMLREDHSCPDGTEECGCEVIPFSGSKCDVCGTRLAGERHAVSFFARA
jgi:hypothetical protein